MAEEQVTTVEGFANVGVIIRQIYRSPVFDLRALFHLGQEATVEELEERLLQEFYVQERADSGVAMTDLRKLMDLSWTWVGNVAASGVVRLQAADNTFLDGDFGQISPQLGVADVEARASMLQTVLARGDGHIRTFLLTRDVASVMMYMTVGGGNRGGAVFPYAVYDYDLFGLLVMEEAFRLSWPALDRDVVKDYLSAVCQRMEHLELKQFVKFIIDHGCLEYVLNDIALSDAFRPRIVAADGHGFSVYLATWLDGMLVARKFIGAMELAGKAGLPGLVEQINRQFRNGLPSPNQQFYLVNGSYQESLEKVIRRFRLMTDRCRSHPPANPGYFCAYERASLPVGLPAECKVRMSYSEARAHHDNSHVAQTFPELFRHVKCSQCDLHYLVGCDRVGNILARAEHGRQCLKTRAPFQLSWEPSARVPGRRREVRLPAAWDGLARIRAALGNVALQQPMKMRRPYLCKDGGNVADIVVLTVSYGIVAGVN